MTLEDLKTLAADLYKDAESAMPIVGDGDKKEWMGRRLDEMLEDNDPGLNCLMGFDTTAEAIDFLENEYKERKEDIADREMPPCATQPRVNHDQQKSSSQPFHTVGTNRDRVDNDSQYMQDPTIVIEEQILIIEDSDPNYIESNMNRSSDDDNLSCRIR